MQGGYARAQLIGCICEYTNPFMNIRYFLLEPQLKESKASHGRNGLAFLLAGRRRRTASRRASAATWCGAAKRQISALPLWRSASSASSSASAAASLHVGVQGLRGALKILFAGEHPKFLRARRASGGPRRA